jgi:hypothetical protein
MARHYNKHYSPLVRIVYTKQKLGKTIQLVPMELYADGSLKPMAVV